MTPQAKKKMFLVMATAFIIVTAGLFAAMSKMKENFAEQAALTAGLPESVTKIFDSRYSGTQHVMADEFLEKVPFRSYLFFTQHPAEAGGRHFSHSYSKSVNEKLGTDIYYGLEDIDGVVFEMLGLEVTGYYGENYEHPKQAMRHYRVLNYMTLPDMVIVRQDTLRGGDPPASIKSRETVGIGKDVKENDIVASIKAAIN